jgi:hypothetical protein
MSQDSVVWLDDDELEGGNEQQTRTPHSELYDQQSSSNYDHDSSNYEDAYGEEDEEDEESKVEEDDDDHSTDLLTGEVDETSFVASDVPSLIIATSQFDADATTTTNGIAPAPLVIDLLEDEDDIVEFVEPKRKMARLMTEDDADKSAITTTTTTSTSQQIPSSIESVQHASSTSDNGYDKLKDNLKCIICLELFHKPITLAPCSHVFCAGCFAGWNKLNCPSCRQNVSMIFDAPKNISNMVDDYVLRFPSQARSVETTKELDAKDRHPRGVPLFASGPSGPQQPVQHRARPRGAITFNEAIERFVELTGATRNEARDTIQGATVRGLSLDHAINHYFQTHGGN